MKLYCLSSITRISPPQNYIPPKSYVDGADEVVFNEDIITKTELQNISSRFSLTEINIGWKEIRGTVPKKIYILQIYQSYKHQLLTFRMIRAFVTKHNLKNNPFSFDLYLATSKIPYDFSVPACYRPDFDLKIRVRCIKNTSVKGIITLEEETEYKKLEEKISEFCVEEATKNPDVPFENLQEDAITKLEQTLMLENKSTVKVLRQKLTDFEQAISLLCDPETGSYANIPVNVYDPITKKSTICRFNTKAENLLFLKESTWYASKSRKPLHEQADKFRDCIILQWNNTYLKDLNSKAINFQSLRDIDFKNVELCLSKEYLHPIMKNLNFTGVNNLVLQDCKITGLSDELFKYLPSNLRTLRLDFNDITFISPLISKLTNLRWFCLNNNKNLSDATIPWSDLPKMIHMFDFKETNISEIPAEIERLENLQYLHVSSPQLKYICWNGLCNDIKELSVEKIHEKELHSQEVEEELNEINVVQLNDKLKMKLSISNFKLTKINATNLPQFLDELSLINTGLETFDTKDITVHQSRFQELNLSNNSLKTFSWNGCPTKIWKLSLSFNKLQNISIINNERNLNFTNFDRLNSLSLEDNQLSSLPWGFENLPRLSELNLSSNAFNYEISNLHNALWDRLPKTLRILRLDNINKIGAIPCSFIDFQNMKNLHISNCNLRYICPYLHTAVQEAGRFLVIDASKNPDLKLSFIPSKIYEFPTADFKATVGELPRLGSYRPCIPNYANFSTITFLDKDEELRDTSRIYKIEETTQENYKFNSIGIEQDESFCNCCAACGEFTNELLFCQQIPMDSVLLVKEESENQTEYFNEKLLKAAVFFEPGHWKAKVKSRLCINCMHIFNTKINAFYGEFQNGIKRTKCANIENNEKTDKSAPEPITPPISLRKIAFQNQLPQILPETSDDLQSQLPCNTETSTSGTLLPPINTIRASYYNTNNSELQNLPDQATTNFIQRLEYARIADNEYPDRFENSYYYNPTRSLPPPEIPVTYTFSVKQKTVLLDPSGNPIAIWEPLPDSSNYNPSFTSL